MYSVTHIRRFAEIIVDTFGHEGTFDIDSPFPDATDRLIEHLQELGCVVTRAESHDRLTVTNLSAQLR